MAVLESLWEELENGPAVTSGIGRRRLDLPGSVGVYATLTAPRGERGVALVGDSAAIEQLENLPATRGIEHLRYPGSREDVGVLELRLTDPSAAEIFATLAADVALHAAAAADRREAVGRWIGRVSRWIRLLERAAAGLSSERQRGLYGELWMLRERLSPRVGIESAVLGWAGPSGGHDFQLTGGSFEVKTTATNEPQVVTIASERQLDETGTSSLHLVHLSVDIHQHSGESLAEAVDHARALAAGSGVEAEFADRLLDAGYSDVHRGRYVSAGFTIRQESFFRVGPGFPRIVEADLPAGVGGVSYRLVIASCRPHEVTREQAVAAL